MLKLKSMKNKYL